MSRKSLLKFALIAICSPLFISNAISSTYKLPSQPLQNVVEQTKNVSTRLSPDKQWLAVLTPRTHLTINNLAANERKLAGLRVSKQSLTPSRVKYSYSAIELVNLKNPTTNIQLPLANNMQVANVSFSPDSRFLSYIGLTEIGANLYIYDIAKDATTQLNTSRLNATLGLKYLWKNNSKGIFTNLAIAHDTQAKATLAIAPNISQTIGKKAPRRTYQDLLKNPQDEAEFSALTTSQLSLIDLQGNSIAIGMPAINISYSLSPDDKYLIVKRVKAPFSYMVKYYDFAQSVELFSTSGEHLTTLAQLESSEYRPPGSDSVRKGPRLIHWRTDKPSTLAFVKALDKGDSRLKTAFRDQLLQLSAPFNQPPTPLTKTPWRISKVQWGELNTAVITERQSDKKQMRVSLLDTSANSNQQLSLWYQKAIRDTYKDPGRLYRQTIDINGEQLGRVVKLYNNGFLHYGLGASPQGLKPFLKSLPIEQHKPQVHKTQTLWSSANDKLESIKYVVNLEPLQLIISRQTADTPPELVMLDTQSGLERSLYKNAQPLQAYKGMTRQLVNYTRNDGLPLSGILYLPANYNKADGPLPVLMWAYPREYKNAEVASQVNYSANQYQHISSKGPVPFVANGYAIFDKVAMPIVGEGNEKPNDSFRDQLVANASAAIDTLVKMGVADRERVAIGGHSYGAFMVANLLAHSDLFAAGIARSGAYNRSLTPFGFQHEKRNFWEAPSLYQQISPFTHADKIDEPLLLMHGEMDSNSGTYPMQSARLFKAIRGLGGQARLVTFPYESHSYKAKESIMHMLWEQENWLEQYLKQAPSAKTDTAFGQSVINDTQVTFH
ncbi:alpha/beta hydrolase family protein [Shewanella fidelis]|uniref:Prolyl oligopeptidase family serine peptidase n=1 Tax=Shewanella fidelis TaxID=173509 RepID=A0AAW8NR15_9GAMM|nr:prolyl oligopeptidase family serine peptidase [Shewanella fidelis]MDR8524820.1 prolyl oligopeptidase family serine peptidase [Shewanella fidelis]MDW4810891.1 prolyl oligopeptidase family serine peptidase [Shewanella fidelis]MDW4815330.1 prolyl oligopeptidase family serine peptidase [Shewanella fidelis]MDW4819420.1 prolyl oligopeptidase family serine peptidase [Shewanella fidelis]MDW4822902.1 prolyl oligopeptidase family serine peptidase [Shewanella fidelis]